MVTAYLYNPPSANRDRTTEIIQTLERADVIALIGTQQKAGKEPVTTYPVLRHKVFGWGWKEAKLSNKSAGVVLALGPR